MLWSTPCLADDMSDPIQLIISDVLLPAVVDDNQSVASSSNILSSGYTSVDQPYESKKTQPTLRQLEESTDLASLLNTALPYRTAIREVTLAVKRGELTEGAWKVAVEDYGNKLETVIEIFRAIMKGKEFSI